MKMEKNKLLLVDGENLLHRSFHKFERFKSNSGKPSGAIYGFFKSLHAMVFRFNTNSVLVVFDNGRSKYRNKILPNYKGDRTRIGMDYDSLQSQKRVIMKLLKYLNIPYIFDKDRLNNYEADDYIALATKNWKDEIIILSSDKDFCQLITSRIKIYNPGKEQLINDKTCKDVMGYSPDKCVDYLTLAGDNSDNIPGYPGIGDKKAKQFLDKYGSIEEYLTALVLGDPPMKGIEKDKLKEVYSIGRNLIDLEFFLEKHPLNTSMIPLVYTSKDAGKSERVLKRVFNRYSLTSFKTKEFINVFKKLEPWTIENCFLPF